MPLEVYFPEDIRNALLAAEDTIKDILRAANNDGTNEFLNGYEMGYGTAMKNIALAFGLFEPAAKQICEGGPK